MARSYFIFLVTWPEDCWHYNVIIYKLAVLWVLDWSVQHCALFKGFCVVYYIQVPQQRCQRGKGLNSAHLSQKRSWGWEGVVCHSTLGRMPPGLGVFPFWMFSSCFGMCCDTGMSLFLHTWLLCWSLGDSHHLGQSPGDAQGRPFSYWSPAPWQGRAIPVSAASAHALPSSDCDRCCLDLGALVTFVTVAFIWA